MKHPRFVQIVQAVDSLCALDESGKVWSYQPLINENSEIVGMGWRQVEDYTKTNK